MPIRWNEINPNKGAKLIRPREVYASLQGRKWSRLRPEQSEVLKLGMTVVPSLTLYSCRILVAARL